MITQNDFRAYAEFVKQYRDVRHDLSDLSFSTFKRNWKKNGKPLTWLECGACGTIVAPSQNEIVCANCGAKARFIIENVPSHYEDVYIRGESVGKRVWVEAHRNAGWEGVSPVSKSINDGYKPLPEDDLSLPVVLDASMDNYRCVRFIEEQFLPHQAKYKAELARLRARLQSLEDNGI